MPHKAKTKKKRVTNSWQCRKWHKLYNTRQWKRLRASHLWNNPLCVECLKNGKSVAASIVDHIKPHKGNTHLFNDCDNLQSLCKYHHDKKTWEESIGKD